MKTFLAVLLLAFLVSCGEESVVETPNPTPTEQTSSDISSAIDELPAEIVTIVEETVETQTAEAEVPANSKVTTLSTKYTNPKFEVEMEVSYALNDDNTLSEISVTSASHPDDKHITKINNEVQGAIGKTLEEASEYSVAGSSLASAAFQKTLKSI